jgi:hypothetical protein
MGQLLARDPVQQPQDPEGSLTDGSMGAYYTWINQPRLAGADLSRFLVWFEGHGVVCAVFPTLPQGTTSWRLRLCSRFSIGCASNRLGTEGLETERRGSFKKPKLQPPLAVLASSQISSGPILFCQRQGINVRCGWLQCDCVLLLGSSLRPCS